MIEPSGETGRDGLREAPAPAPDAVGRRHGRILPKIAVAAALLHPLATLLARRDWRADLLTHFPGPALAATLVAAAVVVRRRPWLAAALALLGVFQGLALPRYARVKNPVVPASRAPARLRILMANVLCVNERFEDLAGLIRRERPDIVGLVEYSPPWIEGLAEVRREFPHRMEVPRGGEGMALWFRDPPRTLDPARSPHPEAWPYLHATFEFAGAVRHLWLVHPRSPLTRGGFPELKLLADEIRRVDGSRIVVGDLNSSEGSPRFGDFVRDSGLRDSRFGFGRQPSWPVGSPYMIAIDHAFVSDDLAVVDRRLGPPIGSDHLPLVIDVAPASSTNAARAAKSE